MPDTPFDAAAETPLRRLFVYNGGFLNRRIRRILQLAGWGITTGRPGPDDWIGIWGHSPTSGRGVAMAERSGAHLLHIEDTFLRSIRTGRAGEPPVGLQLDSCGVHFDSAQPSDLEQLLATHPLDDTALLDRARLAMDRIAEADLSKYNTFYPGLEAPAPGYVLVIDQTEGDASIRHSGASPTTFREMLAVAQIEHPGARILVRTHPETAAGHRGGHYDLSSLPPNVDPCTAPISPRALLEGAVAVYTVSSQMGFEAILAGHRPRVFGQPFYAGWGLSDDETPVARRTRQITRPQLFAAAMILQPVWYDPYRDQLCELEQVIDGLVARTRAFREDRNGHIATGMRLWKRRPLQAIFGSEKPLRFVSAPQKACAQAQRRDCAVLAWAGKVDASLETAAEASNVPLVRVEDGFLRSRGLGAELVPPLSLVTDDLGIYYDPAHPSRLEQQIEAASALPSRALLRAEQLAERLIGAGLSKYNVGETDVPDLPAGRRILVPGQVEDDASIRLGCGDICTNLGLLQATRKANPDAVILYKPHPDVETGLRAGAVSRQQVKTLADLVVERTHPVPLINAVDEVWTLTSLLGFEALLRGRSVTCLGAPFYAGWGLTRDLGAVPARRKARPTLAALVHACLITYPRYLDPVTNLPCPVEVVVDRLEHGPLPVAGPFNRSLSKLQGVLASRASLWR